VKQEVAGYLKVIFQNYLAQTLKEIPFISCNFCIFLTPHSLSLSILVSVEMPKIFI
jgi:hypothetical protein